MQVLWYDRHALRSARLSQELRDLSEPIHSRSREFRSTTTAAQTAAFSSRSLWTISRQADFEHYVYNNEYPLIDPDYQDARPRANAALLARLFAQAKPARILDYGGGNGKLASLLRESGFPQVETYDPFVPRFAERPPGLFDCVICFEVLEHTTDPSRTLGDMVEFLTDTGLIV